MDEDIAEQEARELQEALALSLQEFKASQSPHQQQPRAPPKTSEPGPSQMKEKTQPPSGGGGRGRRRKLQPFAPSNAEVEACFRELVSVSRDRVRIDDIVKTGKKLGLDIDHRKASAMLDYVGEQGVTRGVAGGGLTLQDFQAITRHFRVE